MLKGAKQRFWRKIMWQRPGGMFLRFRVDKENALYDAIGHLILFSLTFLASIWFSPQIIKEMHRDLMTPADWRGIISFMLAISLWLFITGMFAFGIYRLIKEDIPQRRKDLKDFIVNYSFLDRDKEERG